LPAVTDRLTPSARRVVAVASEEARGLWHPIVGPEHLLLALARESGTPAAVALQEFGATHGVLRGVLLEVIGAGPQEPTMPPNLSILGTEALTEAARAAVETDRRQVGPGHLLIGVLRVDGGPVPQVLGRLNVHREALRRRVRDLLGADDIAELDSGDSRVVREDDAPEVIGRGPRCPHCGNALAGALELRRLTASAAGGEPTPVRVVSCASCGVALGMFGPPP
jgi:ATP-dependent Clp protease ATP-binding subunit ClpC